jgi:hypothetical protein
MAYTDFQDGHDAKKAQRLLGVSKPLTNGATEDPEADKKFRAAMLQGIETRAIRERDFRTIAFIEAKKAVDARRDERMAADRKLAKEHGLSTAAIAPNRIKTVLEMGGMLLHVSPLANNERVRDLSLGIMAAGTGFGIYGENEYRNTVHDAIAASCPDELDTLDGDGVRIALRDTTPEHAADTPRAFPR